MKLSIIIPYYNVKEYTDELLDVLDPQVKNRSDVEVVVVDDGSKIPYKTNYKWCKVFHKKNGGCATARNMGLNNTTGEYVQFIDADDLVPDYYVERMLKEIEDKHADVYDFSWKSLSTQGSQHDMKLNSDDDRLHNPSVCTRCFKRAYIGEVRFNEKKDCTEDEDFSRKMGYLKTDGFVHASVTDYMYYYRTYVDNSKFKRFKKGLQKTKRIVYYYDHVTADMTDIFEEIKKEDEINEVWLVTKKCDIPEISRYARVSNETRLWGHELRGQAWKGFIHIVPPERADIIIYSSSIKKVFGTTTFIYNFCYHIGKRHSIIVLYDEIDNDVLKNFEKVAKVIKNDTKNEIYCDSLIMNSLRDQLPSNVVFKKTIQMCHACKLNGLAIPWDRDYIVNVSKFSKNTWGDSAKDGIVIHNPTYKDEYKKALILISATRIGSLDKGDNDKRMKMLATALSNKDIPYLWLNFSDKPLTGMPANFINMPATLDIQRFIRKADYLVQLSSRESFPYSVLEALTNNTAVLVTDFGSTEEMKIIDGVHGYILPSDMNFDVTKLLRVPRFNYVYDNNRIIQQWEKLLSMPAAERKGPRPDDLVRVKVVKAFYDRYSKKRIATGEIKLPLSRVYEIQNVENDKKIKLIEILEK